MLESSAAEPRQSTEIAGTGRPAGAQLYPALVVFARAWWPRKTAAHLATAAGVSERAAKFWLAGQREPSPAAFKALIEILMTRRP